MVNRHVQPPNSLQIFATWQWQGSEHPHSHQGGEDYVTLRFRFLSPEPTQLRKMVPLC
jgi:hypothetical protein